MNTNFSEKFEELFQKWQKLSSDVEALRAEIEELKALQADSQPLAEPAADDEEPIDIDLSPEDFGPTETVEVAEERDSSTSLGMTEEAAPEVTEEAAPEVIEEVAPEVVEEVPVEPVVEPKTEEKAIEVVEEPVEEVKEVVPEPVKLEVKPESVKPEVKPEPVAESDDMPESLFGDAPEPIEDSGKGRRRAGRAVYQTSAAPKAVVDAMAAKAAWRIDMPGPEVRSLRSAIALGDQVVFINRLFRKDSSLYQTTIDTLNNTPTLSAAIDYLSETFPEWDLESEDVYRFMMAVRRKIRK